MFWLPQQLRYKFYGGMRTYLPIYLFVTHYLLALQRADVWLTKSFFRMSYSFKAPWHKKYLPHYRLHIKIALPLIISQAGQALTQIVDNAMIGHVDTVSLAGAAFSLSVFFIIMIFGMGFSFGITPLTGATFGDADHTAKAGKLLRHSLVLNGLLSIVLFAISWGLTYALPYMGQEPDVVTKAIPYYQLLVFSLLPLMLFFTLKQWTEGLESVRPAMLFTIAANVINIVLNYLLIYGKGGFEAMGLVGAGWATLWSRVAMAAAMLAYVVYAKPFRAYRPEWMKLRIELEKLWEIAKISLPIGFQFIVEVSAFAMGAIMVGWIGKTELAAHQIALNLASLTFLMSSGIASATMIRVGTQMGLKNYQQIRTVAFAGLHLGLMFMLVCALLFVIGYQWLPALHTTDTEVIRIAATFMLIAAVFQLFDGVQVIAINALRGLSDVNRPALIAFIAHWLISIPIGYVCSQWLPLGANGVWAGFLAGLFTASVLLLRRFDRVTRRLIAQKRASSQL